jgi:hypothetical protein
MPYMLHTFSKTIPFALNILERKLNKNSNNDR